MDLSILADAIPQLNEDWQSSNSVDKSLTYKGFCVRTTITDDEISPHRTRQITNQAVTLCIGDEVLHQGYNMMDYWLQLARREVGLRARKGATQPRRDGDS